MRFYTDVTRYGNQILYRGYKNGERIRERVKFKPTLFVRGESDWKTLDNHPVKPMQFESMRDATEFHKTVSTYPYCKDIWYNKLYASIYYRQVPRRHYIQS